MTEQEEEIQRLKAKLTALVGATSKIVEELADISQSLDHITVTPQASGQLSAESTPKELEDAVEEVSASAAEDDIAEDPGTVSEADYSTHKVGSWKEPINPIAEEEQKEADPKPVALPPPLPNRPKESTRPLEAQAADPKPEVVNIPPVGAVAASETVNKMPNSGIKLPANIENFIGGNLISKLGVLIIIIGVGIGMKYAIDNNLISPVTRVVLGYLLGAGLMFVAFRLKEKYLDYSAVMLGGGLTVLYFVSYAAFAFYDLLPQILTFVLMSGLTVFTVLAALNYNKMLIAIFGLVGAYAVPFLLSTGSGQFEVLFTYMVLVNTGITFLAFRRNWKELHYISFGLTWLIFVAWFAQSFEPENTALSIAFSFLFFVQFYLSTLAYKLVSKEAFNAIDVAIVLLNSFLFYGLGYAALDQHIYGAELVGLFTILNAFAHIVFGFVIFKRGGDSKQLLHFTLVLSLIFVTIAIPVQLDGNWVTILWLVQAVGLFALGRIKAYPIYERFAMILLTVGFFSLLQDYHSLYQTFIGQENVEYMTPLFNLGFMSSIIAIGSLVGIYSINNRFPVEHDSRFEDIMLLFHKRIVPGALLVLAYYSVWLEIDYYFTSIYIESLVELPSNGEVYYREIYNMDLLNFKRFFELLYFILLTTSLALWNNLKAKVQLVSYVSSVLLTLGILAFLGWGLYEVSELRESYLYPDRNAYHTVGIWHLIVRYPGALLALVSLFVLKGSIPESMRSKKMSQSYGLFFYLFMLWYAASELLQWMDIAGSPGNYKLALSILWGMYSLMMVSLGIAKNRVHLRIGGISLFGATLLKLFFYDLSHLSTISKTIVFVSLGILLLIISFLYNKYKDRIEDEEVD